MSGLLVDLVQRYRKELEKELTGKTSYGERMQWSCNLPDSDFNPGDNSPIVLRINCLNSVDTSTPFDISFGLKRVAEFCSGAGVYEDGSFAIAKCPVRIFGRHVR